MKPSQESLEAFIIDTIDGSDRKWTQVALENGICSKNEVSRRDVRRAARKLIDLGHIGYVYEYGSTYLTKSIGGPVRLTDRLVLVPYNRSYAKTRKEAVLRLLPGVSFGDGSHPTTRLAGKGIEYITRHLIFDGDDEDMAVLDIGTGTGVLLIAAVLLGAQTGVGIDIDPCSIHEARQNVILNQLSDRITIRKGTAADIDAAFPLIIANLRLPTLTTLRPWIAEHLTPGGLVLFSGIRSSERQRLLNRYGRKHFEAVWAAEELTWATVALKRTG